MDRIPPDILSRPIVGLRLARHTLAEQLAHAGEGVPTLLVFLRYFGCIFCKEMVKDARDASRTVAGYPPVIVFCQADRAEADEFFARYWPEAVVVCDPAKTFYDAFGLGHGTFAQMFGPRVWACGIRAATKRNMQGIPRKGLGDPWTMPGTFLVDPDGAIRWHHEFDHAGDHPDFRNVMVQAGAVKPAATTGR